MGAPLPSHPLLHTSRSELFAPVRAVSTALLRVPERLLLLAVRE